MKDLGSNAGVSVKIAGLNDKGWVTGTYRDADGFVRSFVYDDTTKTDLPMFDGRLVASRINNRGWVTGYAIPNDAIEMEPERAFVYDGLTVTDLGSLIGAGSQGRGINDSGWITGQTNFGPETDDNRAIAFVSDGTSSKRLGNLGGDYTVGTAINSAGWVTGFGSNKPMYGGGGGASVLHAFLYDGTTMKALGMSAYRGGQAAAINAAGDVVGQYQTPNASTHAFVHVGGTMHDLNDLLDGGASGWVLNRAIAINVAGQILGEGTVAGQTCSFLLTPVP